MPERESIAFPLVFMAGTDGRELIPARAMSAVPSMGDNIHLERRGVFRVSEPPLWEWPNDYRGRPVVKLTLIKLLNRGRAIPSIPVAVAP